MNLNTPIWQLTVGEFLELQKKNLPIESKPDDSKSERIFVYGIRGLAGLLRCSKATAQKIKSSGIIDRAVSQVGRTITIDANLALELIQKAKMKRK